MTWAFQTIQHAIGIIWPFQLNSFVALLGDIVTFEECTQTHLMAIQYVNTNNDVNVTHSCFIQAPKSGVCSLLEHFRLPTRPLFDSLKKCGNQTLLNLKGHYMGLL